MPDTARITISRRFDAPRERVFAAWTDPEQFAVWFGTAATTVTDVRMDVQVGGAWSARMLLPDGTEIAWHGSYRAIDPPSRLALTLTDQPAEDDDPLMVEFAEVDGGTLMTFRQFGDATDDAGYAQAEQGWRGFFDELEALITG